MFDKLRERVKAARKGDHLEIFALDLAMLGLVVANLTLIVVEWLYTTDDINRLLAKWLPEVHAFYGNYIHDYFFEIDLAFVAVFLSELMLRWGYAIYKRTYHAWFFYPFVHWYDTLGCIPLSAFRWLRVFRVFSMVYRLERMGIINLRDTYLFKLAVKYYKILIEELSDRVVINVLDGVKKETQGGQAVINRIMGEVVTPRKEIIIDWISGRLGNAATHTYQDHKEAIQVYVEALIQRSIEENKQVSRIELVPVLGSYVTDTIEKAVSDIVFKVVNNAVNDIAANKNELVNELSDLIFEMVVHSGKDERINHLVMGVLSETLDILKEKVSEKRWKLEGLDDETEEEKLRAALDEEHAEGKDAP